MNTKEFDHLVDTCDCTTLTMGEAANILGIGRNRFMLLLREMGLLLKSNRPSETMRKLGYMELQIKEHPSGNGVKQCSPRYRWGQAMLTSANDHFKWIGVCEQEIAKGLP